MLLKERERVQLVREFVLVLCQSKPPCYHVLTRRFTNILESLIAQVIAAAVCRRFPALGELYQTVIASEDAVVVKEHTEIQALGIADWALHFYPLDEAQPIRVVGATTNWD